jgi:hypothetical protein
MSSSVSSASSLGRERDIDLVLITGAGASREFGTGGKQMPLMNDWSNAIFNKLTNMHPAYLKATGLSQNMTGEEFEMQLGKFLHQVEAFRLIDSLLEASVSFQLNNPLNLIHLQEWHKATSHNLEQIVEAIRESLYEEFSSEGFDAKKATESYEQLFKTLGITHNSRLVVATTNYDVIAETVLESLGYLPDWGCPAATGHSGAPKLHVKNILEGMPRYVPVLHLHGRVGWYRIYNGVENFTSNDLGATRQQYRRDLGVPIVMLPDPNKAYDDNNLISALWAQFQDALQRAKAVLILGHSLNDQALIKAIASNVKPLERVGVTLLEKSGQPDQIEESAKATDKTVKQYLGNAKVITMRFGARTDDDTGYDLTKIKDWISYLDKLELQS